MDRARRLIGAQTQPSAPFDGSGITAAILDTGIAMHPDFGERIAAFRDFVGLRRFPYDDSGHGTHVAGCLCGDGRCSGGRYAGVAKGCTLVVGKVLDERGDGSISHMIEGIRWVLSIRERYGIRILNISVSMGETGQPERMRQLMECLDEAWDAGLFVAVAAGNAGPASGSLSLLGRGSKVVTVGCHDGKDYKGRKHSCERISGRGPAGSVLKKPDLVAPGTDIMSCCAFIRKTAGGYRDAYVRKNGTSMSTPLAAGAAALCMQKFPRYTNEQVKRRILWSASDLGEPWSKQGWGMLDVGRMLRV